LEKYIQTPFETYQLWKWDFIKFLKTTLWPISHNFNIETKDSHYRAAYKKLADVLPIGTRFAR